RTRRNAHESEQHNPSKPDGFVSGKNAFEPRLCSCVERRILVYSVDENVDIRSNHKASGLFNFRNVSSSSNSSASASAFVKSSWSVPRWYVGWMNRGLTVTPCEESPARTASLSARSNSSLRSRA